MSAVFEINDNQNYFLGRNLSQYFEEMLRIVDLRGQTECFNFLHQVTKVALEYWIHDGWNGGQDFFDIRLYSSPKHYVMIDNCRDAIMRQISQVLSEILERDVNNEFIHEVYISPEAPSAIRPGIEISGEQDLYLLGDERGRGKNGVVYNAIRKKDGEKCAVKFLTKDAYDTDQKLKRFLNEIEINRKINHENVIKFLDSGQTVDGEVFYVMERADMSLSDYIKNQSMNSMKGKANVVRGLIHGLKAIHDEGIVHRDLKPDNVLIKNGVVKISDFGLSHAMPTSGIIGVPTMEGERLGNFIYAAPEQRLKGAKASVTMDIYSLGLIIHQLMTGEYAPTVTNRRSYSKLYDVRFSGLDMAVGRALQNSPGDRPKTMAEFVRIVKTPIYRTPAERSVAFRDCRFDKAFYDYDEKLEIRDLGEIRKRLDVLLSEPLVVDHQPEVLAWRGNWDWEASSLEWLPNGNVLIGGDEMRIAKLCPLGRDQNLYWQSCVYVETSPINAYAKTSEALEEMRASWNFDRIDSSELCAFYKGTVVSDAEVRQSGISPEVRTRYVLPFNFLLLPSSHPFANDRGLETDLVRALNRILIENSGIEDLDYMVSRLKQHQSFKVPYARA